MKSDKEWQGVVIRCDRKIETWELILKLLNENVFVSNLADKVW